MYDLLPQWGSATVGITTLLPARMREFLLLAHVRTSVADFSTESTTIKMFIKFLHFSDDCPSHQLIY